MRTANTVKFIFLVLAMGALTSCVGVVTNTTTLAVKSADRDELRPLAEAGDPEAQFELGRSYCCMGPGFDTQTATEWLCRSAHQGNKSAMFELARIYTGDVSRSLAPGQKIMRAMRARTSKPHALMWLSLLEEEGHPGAGGELARIEAEASQEEIELAREMKESWQSQKCDFNGVFNEAQLQTN